MMHRVTLEPVCAVDDALGTGGSGPEGGLPLVQRAMVALVMPVLRVSQVMNRATLLLVMWMAGGGVLVRLMVPAVRMLHMVQRLMVRVLQAAQWAVVLLAMPMARVLWVILMVGVLPVMQWVMVSLTMLVVRVLQALSPVMAMWAASMAGVLWVMLRVVAPLATLTTVRVRRCIWGVAGGADGGGVAGDEECGGSSGDCETSNADGGMGCAGDGKAAEGERSG